MGIFSSILGKKEEKKETSAASPAMQSSAPPANASAQSAVKPAAQKEGDKAKNVCEFC